MTEPTSGRPIILLRPNHWADWKMTAAGPNVRQIVLTPIPCGSFDGARVRLRWHGELKRPWELLPFLGY